MISQKFTKCVDYLIDPINGYSRCCMCCVLISPKKVIKLIGFQDFLVSGGLIIIGMNAMLQLKMFEYFLETLTSQYFIFGIIFIAIGGI